MNWDIDCLLLFTAIMTTALQRRRSTAANLDYFASTSKSAGVVPAPS